MNVAIVTALWKRPELTEVVQDYYANYFDDCTLIAVKSPDDEQPVNSAWHYVEAENKPVAQKFNAVFQEATKFNPDIVVLIGSDDFISYSLIEYYKREYSPDANYMLGIKDLYYHDLLSKETIHWHGLPASYKAMPIGCGRAFSRAILDKLDWKPLGKGTISSGLDTNSTEYMQRCGVGFKSVTMQEAGAVCVDVKCGVSMHTFKNIVDRPKAYGKSEPVSCEVLKIFQPYLQCVSLSS